MRAIRTVRIPLSMVGTLTTTTMYVPTCGSEGLSPSAKRTHGTHTPSGGHLKYSRLASRAVRFGELGRTYVRMYVCTLIESFLIDL